MQVVRLPYRKGVEHGYMNEAEQFILFLKTEAMAGWKIQWPEMVSHATGGVTT
jgi:hypothetical protein